jgi:hypothetical protein
MNKIDIISDTLVLLLKSLSKIKLIEILDKNPFAIALIESPSADLIDLALKKDINTIEFIKNPSEEIIRKVVQQNPELIKFIESPPLALSLELTKQNAEKFIPLINNKDQLFYDEVLGQTPVNFQFVPSQFISEDIKIQYIKTNPDILEYISEKDQSSKLCTLAVSLKGQSLKFVKNQTFEIIKNAITNDIEAFKFINPKVLNEKQIQELQDLITLKRLSG